MTAAVLKTAILFICLLTFILIPGFDLRSHFIKKPFITILSALFGLFLTYLAISSYVDEHTEKKVAEAEAERVAEAERAAEAERVAEAKRAAEAEEAERVAEAKRTAEAEEAERVAEAKRTAEAEEAERVAEAKRTAEAERVAEAERTAEAHFDLQSFDRQSVTEFDQLLEFDQLPERRVDSSGMRILRHSDPAYNSLYRVYREYGLPIE